MVLASSPTRASSRTGGDLADALLLLLGGATFLIATILWLDNAQGGLTGNGVFKSMELRPWIADPGTAPLYPANYLYYPVYGALCRLLDLLGVFAGDPRRQVTILNALSASLCLVLVYRLVRAVTGDRATALLAATFHISCSFVLLLAITNEDIMPGYTAMLAAMALAAVWFAEPTALRVATVALVFSVGWLFEWRLMFPTLPAMLLGLWLCEPRLARRLGWITLFLATTAAAACLVAAITHGHNGAAGPLQLLWTGKAVVSVWAGFTWAKLGYLSDGVAAYLLGTAITTFPGIPGWDIWRWVSVLASLSVAILALRLLWTRRDDHRARALAAVFGGTFVAGQVFNLYGQPQDPQMQVNVMAWLTAGFAIVVMAARQRWGTRGFASLAALTACLLAYNLWSLAPLRGQDTAWQRTIERLERLADPEQTVFLIHDFDWAMVYASLHWGLAEPGTDLLGPAPQAAPKFKWLGFTSQVLRHPKWSAERHVADLRRQIDRALELGYDVVVVRLWDMDLATLESSTGMVVDSGRLDALRAMLHRDYAARLVVDDALAGGIYRLRPASRP